MKANTKFLFPVVLAVIYLSACSASSRDAPALSGAESMPASGEEHAPLQETLPVIQSQAPEGRIHLSPSYRFRKETLLSVGDSWDEELAVLTTSEKTYLEEVNSNYFGVLSYGSIEELQRLAALGFPMPEEWMDSRNLTDTELKRMADTGNIKARMFYADRLINEASKYLPLRNTSPPSFDSSPGRKLATLAYIESGKLLRSTSSPYAAYVQGRAGFVLDAAPSPEFVAGAMAAASNRGDARAQNFLREFSARHPGMDVSLIMSASEMGKPNGSGG